MSPRSTKIGSLVHDHLGQIIPRMLTPNQIGILTITAVEVSGDLSLADVYVSALRAPQGYIDRLNRESKKLVHELRKVVHLQKALEIRFKPDKSVEHADKMRKLMEEAKE